MMRAASLSFVAVLAFSVTAVAGGEEGPIEEAILALKDAFTEEGIFDTDAREALMEAHDVLVELQGQLEELLDEKQLAVMSLQSLTSYNLACLDAIEGDLDGALEWLDEAVAAGYTDADWMAEDPDLEPLHGDPRFEELLQRAYEIEESMELNWTSPSDSCEDCEETECGPGSGCGCGCDGS